MHDVVIIGGGPAGLNAALILGRCRRRVLLCDTGRPRNAHTKRMTGFLSRDGTDPAELRDIARQELRRYPSIEIRDIEVVDVQRRDVGFEVGLADRGTVRCRKLLIASGLIDELPDIPGIEALYGKSAFHCPYCDGWELCDAPLAIYGRGDKGHDLALELLQWSRDLVLCTNGPGHLDPAERESLARHGVAVREEVIQQLEGEGGELRRILFATGEALERRGLFFVCEKHQATPFAEKLGVRPTSKGPVHTGRLEDTGVPGLYVAGDASLNVQFAIIAAAEGATAAFAINSELMKEDRA